MSVINKMKYLLLRQKIEWRIQEISWTDTHTQWPPGLSVEAKKLFTAGAIDLSNRRIKRSSSTALLASLIILPCSLLVYILLLHCRSGQWRGERNPDSYIAFIFSTCICWGLQLVKHQGDPAGWLGAVAALKPPPEVRQLHVYLQLAGQGSTVKTVNKH